MQRVIARVSGVVQGVGYRAFALRAAKTLKLTGYVRNCADGSVEVVAEGEEQQLQQFLETLRRGPDGARVSCVEATYQDATTEHTDFEIRY